MTPYFKAFESRDETIGRGTFDETQALTCLVNTMMSTDIILLWPTVAEAMLKTVKESVWQWARRRKVRRCTF